MKKVELDKNEIIHEYVTLGMGAGAIAKKHKTAPKRIRTIIDEFGIEHKKAGSQIVAAEKVVEANAIKYPPIKDKKWVVFDPNTDFTSPDVGNKSGVLTSYIEKQYGIPTPPNYDRSKYYTSTGDYWWEQWLSVRLEEVETNKETRLTRWASLDKDALCDEFVNTDISIDALAKKYQIGKKRIQGLIKERNLSRNQTEGSITVRYKRGDHKIQKYPQPSDDSYLVVYDPNTDFATTDILNKGGHLTSYIERQYGVPTPTVYDRNVYYIKTGNYWWEQWLRVKTLKKRAVKKCPYCDWVTVDVDNNSGWFKQHLATTHKMSVPEHLEKHPEDLEYFLSANPTKNNNLETDPKKYVTCPICGNKYRRLTRHVEIVHGLSRLDFAILYSNVPTLCESELDVAKEKIRKVNMEGTFTKHSTYEQTICDILDKAGIEHCSDRKILNGKEIDILIPGMNIGIEVDGCEWHTEKHGKDKHYHLNKTLECRTKGISLIHIFDDEIHDHRRVVLSKIRRMLNIDGDLPKIDARKCEVKPITSNEATMFLECNHIQGAAKATVYLGAFCEEELVGVMTFLKEAPGEWNLTRFATDINYLCRGVGGKLFKYFTDKADYNHIKSFLDRRWCVNEESNFYTKLGFDFDSYTLPDYRYYHRVLTKNKRVHKFLFRKQRMMQKYGDQLSFDMTEREMTEKLGLERIWDCGLIRYVYTNPKLK